MTDVSSYLHRLLGNETLRDNILRHFASIEKFLSHPACEIIEQIKFDLDLIEVSNGYCFSIKSRSFIPCPIPTSKLGKISPRAFVLYDHTTTPRIHSISRNQYSTRFPTMKSVLDSSTNFTSAFLHLTCHTR